MPVADAVAGPVADAVPGPEADEELQPTVSEHPANTMATSHARPAVRMRCVRVVTQSSLGNEGLITAPAIGVKEFALSGMITLLSGP